MNNLNKIRENTEDLKYRIIIRTNISQNSLQNLDEYIEFLYNDFGRDDRFTFKFKTVDKLEGTNDKEIKKLKIDNANKMFEKLINSAYKLNYESYFDHLSNGICRSGKRNNFVLGPDGTIYKCLVYFDKDENKVGYFDNNGNMIIDESKLSLWINNYSNVKECNNCSNSARCLGGKCVANRIFKNKVKCNFSNNHINNVVMLLAKTGGNKKIEELK